MKLAGEEVAPDGRRIQLRNVSLLGLRAPGEMSDLFARASIYALPARYEPFGLTKDLVLTGAERTSVWQTVQDVAKRFRYEIKPDPRPEQGSYFRSDHFSLARVGVPAFSINSGNEFWGKPADFGDKMFAEFNEKHYHQPSDEYNDKWDFAGMQQISRFGFALGLEVANQEKLPERIKP